MLQERKVAILGENPRSRWDIVACGCRSTAVTRRSDFFPDIWFPEFTFSGSFCPRSGHYRPGSPRPRISPRPRGEKSRPLSRVLSWTVIPLGCASPRSSSDLPGSLMWATCAADRRRVLPYLVLLQVGFAVPLMLPPARCALTAPFHPYRHRLRGT